MKDHFDQFARYNQWANARLYEAALALPEDDYRRDVGAFFHSLHGTLNHLLVADRIWMKRLTGEGRHPDRLDAILHEDRIDLALARADEDRRILGHVAEMDDQAFGATMAYATLGGQRHEQVRAEVLAHFFNHQTHHRGQAHAILSICGVRKPPSLDLLVMQRGVPAPDLAALATAARG